MSVTGVCFQGFSTLDAEHTHCLGGERGAAWRGQQLSRDSMFLGLCGDGRGLQKRGLGPEVQGMCRPPLGTLQFLPTCLEQEFQQRDTLVQVWPNSRRLGGHNPPTTSPYSAGLVYGECSPLAHMVSLRVPRPFFSGSLPSQVPASPALWAILPSNAGLATSSKTSRCFFCLNPRVSQGPPGLKLCLVSS